MNWEKTCAKALPVVAEVAAFIGQETGRVTAAAIEEKARNSLVSYVDLEAERRLVDGLGRLLQGSVFLTEEKTAPSEAGDLRWIIDPLDGTTNFLHQLPCFSVSVALQAEGRTVVGIVFEINRRECFYAWKNGGAWLNGQPVRVGAAARIEETLLATGFPYYDYAHLDAYLRVLRGFMLGARGIRRLGSAAVDLAYVACGRFDGFFEYSLNIWDIAGGAFLIEQAGGKVTDFSGSDQYLRSGKVVAGNPVIHRQLLSHIAEAFPDG
jgi:myo-inositol-1(or 4)-monophosphatase